MCSMSRFRKRGKKGNVRWEKQGNGARYRNGDKISDAAGRHVTYRPALISVETPEMVSLETVSSLIRTKTEILYISL